MKGSFVNPDVMKGSFINRTVTKGSFINLWVAVMGSFTALAAT